MNSDTPQQALRPVSALCPSSADASASAAWALGEDLFAPQHQMALERAFLLLEGQNFAARLVEVAGRPFDRMRHMMPETVNARLDLAIESVIRRCLNLAITSLDATSRHAPANRVSALAAGVSGGVSGFFGLAALPIELPVTTTLMLRAIADTARHQGEDLSRLEARLACLEVFALGAGSSERRMDMGYYACRTMLSKLASDAAVYLIERTVPGALAPVVNRLVSEIATRFGVVVSERLAAGALPVLGAVGGATINFIFMNHFQRVAEGHFTIRRLERIYGAAAVRRRYEEMQLR
jgi:hypothetical protein